MTERTAEKRRIVAVRDGKASTRFDHLAGEEPMEVRVDGQAVAVTMRTPGDDFELALGFCLTEGIVVDQHDVAGMRYCSGLDATGRQTYNVVDVETRSRRPVAPELQRHVYTSSSCGICGTASLEAVRKHTAPVGDDPLRIHADVLAGLPDRLRRAQTVFERTGGLHAAAISTADGELVCVREDVGRHNAVDKVIGWAATELRLPLSGHVLVVSGRIAFEIVQKALAAGMPAIAAVSAPTNLAVALAADAGMTMAGFVRDGSMNLYAGEERVLTA